MILVALLLLGLFLSFVGFASNSKGSWLWLCSGGFIVGMSLSRLISLFF